jgi:hypothetical protein
MLSAANNGLFYACKVTEFFPLPVRLKQEQPLQRMEVKKQVANIPRVEKTTMPQAQTAFK